MIKDRFTLFVFALLLVFVGAELRSCVTAIGAIVSVQPKAR